MLSEKKVSKKSPSKMNKNEHFFRLGTNRAIVKGKSEHMLTRRSLGRDSGTTLDNKDTYNIRRSRTSKMFGCCLRRRVVGVWGQSPREPGCRGGCSCWVWAKPTVLFWWSRGSCHPAVVTFLLIHYAEIFLSRSGRIFSENLHPTLDNIRLFSRSAG